jgi:hypothetical protein
LIDGRDIVRLKGFGQLKNPMTSLVIEPVTSQLVTVSQQTILPRPPHSIHKFIKKSKFDQSTHLSDWEQHVRVGKKNNRITKLSKNAGREV